eukprot:gene41194-50991_t
MDAAMTAKHQILIVDDHGITRSGLKLLFAGHERYAVVGALDRGALVMVGVVLDRSTPESFRDFEKAVEKLKFILDCHLVAGDFDYFLKIRVGDMADFAKCLHQIVGGFAVVFDDEQ